MYVLKSATQNVHTKISEVCLLSPQGKKKIINNLITITNSKP